ncbi:MAG TPA: hypothetical protein VFZ00_11220 [Solirubrobacter sp.]|nr:hypothetical protein [Solirubrobacter sp.]
MTILAEKKAAAAAQAAPVKPVSLLARARAQAPRGEFVEMPLVGRVWVELVGEATVDEIEGATLAAMKAEGLDLIAVNMPSYDSCRTALTLAHAVRNPENKDERVGTAEEWRSIDIDLILACGLVYNDVRERLSPVAMGAITAETLRDIRLAIEKKNAMRLRSHGVVALSLYLLSTADPPATSPTTKSSTGESP